MYSVGDGLLMILKGEEACEEEAALLRSSCPSEIWKEVYAASGFYSFLTASEDCALSNIVEPCRWPLLAIRGPRSAYRGLFLKKIYNHFRRGARAV
jgi:hypothetical protein